MEKSRPSFFWPLLFSLLLIHLPLAFLLIFLESDPALFLPQQPQDTALQPLMIDLKALPLVDMAEPEQQQIPDHPSAVSQYNVKTESETTAATTPPLAKTAPPPQPRQKSTPPDQPPEQTPDPSATQPPKSETLGDLLAGLDQKQKESEKQFDRKFNSSAVAPPPQFTKQMQSSGDFVPHYKVGGRTYVNALAYPHVDYYIAMKRKFQIAWNPFPSLRQNTSKLPPHQIETVWGLTINAKGELVNLTLIQSSPIAGYDNEARRTIQVSAPFSPPSADLLKGQPSLDVAWGFVVYYQ